VFAHLLFQVIQLSSIRLISEQFLELEDHCLVFIDLLERLSKKDSST
jgi:hypothetical protein